VVVVVVVVVVDGGAVVVVVVVVGGGLVVVVVVAWVVAVVGADRLVVVVVSVGCDFLVVVVVVVATVVVMGRAGVVVLVETTGAGSSRFGADAGAVVAALVVGTPSDESNLPPYNGFADVALGFAGLVLVVDWRGLAAVVVVEEAEPVLGAAAFVGVVEEGLLSDGGASLCTNPT
jgi:hypothetical protein